MKLAAGVVAGTPFVVPVPGVTLVQFNLSVDRLNDTALLDCGSAPAGRYTGEMLRRLRRLVPEAGAYLAFSPQIGASAASLHAVLQRALGEDPRAPFRIFTHERTGVPLAYMLSAEAVEACPPVHLSLLSSQDGLLDVRFLRASLGEGHACPVALAGHLDQAANGFFPVNPALHDLTRHAAQVLEAAPEGAARSLLVREGPRCAVVGYHAGDLLFALQGLALETTAFRSVAVPPDYADIVTCVRPDLECLVVQLPVPFRGGYHITNEAAELRDYIPQLAAQGVPTDRFFHLMRPLFRDYNRARHHLRELAAFAAGGSGHAQRPLPALPLARGSGAGRARPAPGAPARIVLHFDAGWPLKSYPQERRAELLALLIDKGYAPVILGAKEPSHPGVQAFPYTDLASFRALLGTAAALIGCDSFPAHFAEACGVPTVVLFGSTPPSHARGQESPRYRYLHHPMACVPCSQLTDCKLDGGQSCHALATAGEALAALGALVPPPQEGPPQQGERG